MIIVSFNINGLRSHLHQIEKIINIYNPDFIAIQETKVSNNIFPINFFNKYKYNVYFNGNKNHYGVALASKILAKNIYFEFTNNLFINFYYRIIIGEFYIKNSKLILVNIYTPHGNNKFDEIKYKYKIYFIKSLINFIKYILLNNKDIYFLILGDINISPNNIDIGLNYKDIILWKKLNICSFLDEEIFLFNKIIDSKLVDLFRFFNKKSKKFTWFSYKNNSFLKNEGLRIDMFLSNYKLLNKCIFSDIDYNIRNMNSTSDHAPIISKFII